MIPAGNSQSTTSYMRGTGGMGVLKYWFLAQSGDAGNYNKADTTWIRNNDDDDDDVDTIVPLPRILLLDGGVSTHLESQPGCQFHHRALWSSSLLLTDPDRITTGHVDWYREGQVNLISTVTYQCHYESTLWPGGNVIHNEAHMDQLWQQAVQLAHAARNQVEHDDDDQQAPQSRFHGIIASSGCFGAALANGAEYTGDYGTYNTLRALRSFHGRKLQTMCRLHNQLDGIAVETIPSKLECQALRDLFCNMDTGNYLACWISLACRNGHELNDGTPVTEALDILQQIPVDRVQAFGFNCCAATDLPQLLDILLQHYFYNCTADDNNNQDPSSQQEQQQQPPLLRGIVLYPNSGELWNAQDQEWEPGTGIVGDKLADLLLQCIRQIEQAAAAAAAAVTKQNKQDPNLDARRWTTRVPRIIVGGCCRTTPQVMAALRRRIDQHLQAQEQR